MDVGLHMHNCTCTYYIRRGLHVGLCMRVRACRMMYVSMCVYVYMRICVYVARVS